MTKNNWHPEVVIVKMEKDIEFIKESQEKMDRKFDEFIVKIDKKYASKYVETAFWWFLGAVGSIIISAIMYLIINVP